MTSVPAPTGFRGALGRALTSSLCAAIGLALLDVLGAAARATVPISGFAFIRSLQAAVGLTGITALAIAVPVGLVIGGLQATFPADGTLGAWIAALRKDQGRDRDHAAGLLGAALSLGVVGAVVFGFTSAIALEMAAKRNAALSTAMVAAAAVLLGVLAWFPLWRLGHVLVGVLPRPRALVLLGAIGLTTAAGVVAAIGSVDWRVIDFGPVKALALFVLLQVLAWMALSSTRVARIAVRISPSIRGLVRLGLGATVLLCLLVTWLRFGDDPRAIALLGEETAGTKLLFRVARRVADADHDGFAGRLGGGDCNDADPRVYPGADEVRDNGVDEDCDGVDLSAVAGPSVAEAGSAAATRTQWKGNLLVLTIDTLRADRLTERVAPRMHALAAQSIRFTHAYAQAPNTPRSFPSFLTSRYPSEIKWARQMANFSPILTAPENTTFFQALKGGGLRPIGIFSHFYLVPAMGIAGGFDEWDNQGALNLHDSNTDVASPRITERVVDRLRRLGKDRSERFVLWTHLFEPHSRYMEHAQFPTHSSGLKGLEEKYDGEVSFTDLHVGKILDALEETGLAKDTAVVIFSDHGEAFGEHKFGGERMFFHGQTLYDELLRVPLLVRVPGLPPRTVEDPVMLIDLGPTILDLVKVDRPPSFQGRSLLPAMLGDPLPPRPVYAELLPAPAWNHRWRALISDGAKLIEKLSENTIEVYDLAKDPREQRNLTAEAGEVKARLQAALRTLIAGKAGR